MTLLKKIAETIKGQEITENCCQQEEESSKSEMTPNQNSSHMDLISRNLDLAKTGGSIKLSSKCDHTNDELKLEQNSNPSKSNNNGRVRKILSMNNEIKGRINYHR